ncbi:MAG: GHKL domain-containing protein [Pedobacter sp.]|nr:MAG: GHKL domain-containing protein [Pedobacter sp.]
MRAKAILLFAFLLCFFAASAQGIKSSLNFDYRNLGKQLTYFEDTSATLTLVQIKAIAKEGKFIPGKQEILNLGNTKSAFWIKLENLADYEGQNYLIVDAPNIEHIDCYIPLAGNKVQHLQTGSLSRPVKDVTIESNFVFKLPPAQEAVKAPIYLRVQTRNILLVPIKLATPDAIMKGKAIKDRIEYIYIGVLVSLLLFNLFLYFSLKDITYLYYTMYVFSLSLYLLVYIRGYGFLFGDDLRILFSYHPHVFLSLSMMASLLFCRKFLNLQQTVPAMVKLYYALGVLAVVLLFTSLFGYKSVSASIAQVMTVTLSIVVWISGVIAYRRGHKPAKWYIIAWFFIWLTVGIVTLSLGGVIPNTEFTVQLVPIGSTIELLLLSFALGDRYKIIIQKEQDLRDENLMLVQNQKQQLETLVQKRTALLTTTIAELESSNAVKNKLFSIISHDLRSPLNSLISILSLNDTDALTMEDIQYLLRENKKNIETIYNTLNNLLHWAKSQMSGITTDPSSFDLKSLIEELMLIYTPLMQKKSIVPVITMDGVFGVFADENQIRLVLRNLIDNAIKFTPKSQQIGISLKHSDDSVQICVKNATSSTTSIHLDSMTDLSAVKATYGTENEKGVGLGLHLCREYVQSNGGELLLISKENEISFTFKLPQSAA